jgi:hypothetical protein
MGRPTVRITGYQRIGACLRRRRSAPGEGRPTDTLTPEIVAVAAACYANSSGWLRGYGRSAGEIAASIRDLADSANVNLDRPAVEAGLALLDAGGDFADGVIAFEGRRLGGSAFTSFDRQAVELLAATGAETCLLSTT